MLIVSSNGPARPAGNHAVFTLEGMKYFLPRQTEWFLVQ